MDTMESPDPKLNSLHLLSLRDRYQVQAQYVFPSFASVVEALVTNSLRALATEIYVRIDLEKLDVQVIDNGKVLRVD